VKKILLVSLAAVLGFTAFAFAAEYIIEPRYPDLKPNDGFMDSGTWQNPYVVKDRYGREKAVIRPRFPDFNPNDNFMDPGTPFNPWVIEAD